MLTPRSAAHCHRGRRANGPQGRARAPFPGSRLPPAFVRARPRHATHRALPRGRSLYTIRTPFIFLRFFWETHSLEIGPPLPGIEPKSGELAERILSRPAGLGKGGRQPVIEQN